MKPRCVDRVPHHIAADAAGRRILGGAEIDLRDRFGAAQQLRTGSRPPGSARRHRRRGDDRRLRLALPGEDREDHARGGNPPCGIARRGGRRFLAPCIARCRAAPAAGRMPVAAKNSRACCSTAPLQMRRQRFEARAAAATLIAAAARSRPATFGRHPHRRSAAQQALLRRSQLPADLFDQQIDQRVIHRLFDSRSDI